MEPFKDDNDLIAELRAQRPEPRLEFTAELDERAAAGFPLRSSPALSPSHHLLARLRAFPPRRLVLAGGATALAAIAAATVVVAVSEPTTDSSSLAQLSSTDRPGFVPEALHSGTAGFVPEVPHSSTAAPAETQSSQAAKPSGGEESSGIQYETAVPATSGGGIASSASGAAGTGSTEPSSTGPFAAKAGHREIERSAEIVLGADPTDVGSDAARVFDAVHAADGIVLRSSVTGGAAGDAGARFDLLIPATKLSDALADFSAIDTVVSRHEATDDITAPTVRLGEHLRDSRATIDGLLVQLAGAGTDEERAEVEAELRAERRHAAALRAQVTKLDRRANLSRVSLRIETDPAATAAGEDDNGWGVGDALGDAGHILGIAAGVTIVGLAILAPLALIALLAWLANRARLRRARERALE
jgi:hypothetical protein